MRKALIILGCLLAFFMLSASSCEEQSASEKEQQTQGQSYTSLTSKQPADPMDYSPGRDTAIKWAKRWEEQGKVSYVYIQAPDGTSKGYFIFKGLPVSYCASLTPPEKYEDVEGDGTPDMKLRKAPAMDGLFYTGGSCTQMYGFDAVTDAYYEWTGGGAGGGFNYFLSDQPMTRFGDSQPLGDATIEKVQKKQGS